MGSTPASPRARARPFTVRSPQLQNARTRKDAAILARHTSGQQKVRRTDGERSRKADALRVRAFCLRGDRTVEYRARALGTFADAAAPRAPGETPAHPLPYYPLLS